MSCWSRTATGTAPGWNWEVAGAPAGGNWGLERARVPQMWNLVSALETRGVNNVSTWILDSDFPAHEDVPFEGVHGPAGPGTEDHEPLLLHCSVSHDVSNPALRNDCEGVSPRR